MLDLNEDYFVIDAHKVSVLGFEMLLWLIATHYLPSGLRSFLCQVQRKNTLLRPSHTTTGTTKKSLLPIRTKTFFYNCSNFFNSFIYMYDNDNDFFWKIFVVCKGLQRFILINYPLLILSFIFKEAIVCKPVKCSPVQQQNVWFNNHDDYPVHKKYLSALIYAIFATYFL